MWNSKVSQNAVWLVVLTLVLTGCLKADKHSQGVDGEVAAHFQITRVEFNQGPVQNKSNWSIVVKNSYQLTTCMEDRITQTSLKGHKFRIEGEETIKKDVADDRSCITWTEEIPFEFFVKQPRYLKFERFIV